MAVTAEYFVRALPKDKVFTETHYAFEQDENGNKKMIQKQVETKGGWLVIFPAGHSIRLASDEQLKHFGLDNKAKLVDRDTGLEVNANGIPVALQHLINTERQPDGDTEVLDGAAADNVSETLSKLGVD